MGNLNLNFSQSMVLSYTKKINKAPVNIKRERKLNIDVCDLVKTNIIKVEQVEAFLKDNMKLAGKKGLGEDEKQYIDFRAASESLQVNLNLEMSKRYIKYLLKKFLYVNSLSDYVRVVSTNTKRKSGFKMAYYNN